MAAEAEEGLAAARRRSGYDRKALATHVCVPSLRLVLCSPSPRSLCLRTMHRTVSPATGRVASHRDTSTNVMREHAVVGRAQPPTGSTSSLAACVANYTARVALLNDEGVRQYALGLQRAADYWITGIILCQ